MTPTAVFVTLLTGSSSEEGYKNGQGDTPHFKNPSGIVVANNGSLLVAEKTAGKWQKCNIVSGMASVASNMGWL